MEIAVLCAYAGVLLHLSRRKGEPGEASCMFFVNNRASGAASIAFSLIVSCVGASATMGMAGMAFSIGTPAFWWLGAGAAGITLLALLLAAKVRESGAYTMPEMVEKHLGPKARPLVSIIIVVAWMAILAAQFSALGRLLASFTGFPALACLGIGFVLVVAHTLGGQAVVIRTDRLQFFMLIAGLGLLLYWLNASNPGWTSRFAVEAVNDKFTPMNLLGYLFVVGGNYLVCPMLFGRFLSARDEASARRGGLLAGLGLAACAVLIVAVGLSCRGLLEPATDPDSVLTLALDTAFPRWLAVLVLLALVSAVVSSADSCLVTAATVLSYDLLRSDKSSTGKLCVAVLGCVGVGVTFLGRGILEFLFMAYSVYVAGVVMPVFIAMLLSRRGKIDSRFAVAAIFAGGVLGCLSAVLDNAVYSHIGMAASAGLSLCGIRALPEQTREPR